jgi:hypothetical protein
MRRATPWAVMLGVLSILVGVPYVLGLFGPSEAEVGYWGLISMVGGVLLAVVPPFVGLFWRPAQRLLWGLGGGLLALLQVPPVLCWWAFHSYGISDGTPPSEFVAHWAYSLPHLLVILLAAGLYHALLNRNSSATASRSRTQHQDAASL